MQIVLLLMMTDCYTATFVQKTFVQLEAGQNITSQLCIIYTMLSVVVSLREVAWPTNTRKPNHRIASLFNNSHSVQRNRYLKTVTTISSMIKVCYYLFKYYKIRHDMHYFDCHISYSLYH